MEVRVEYMSEKQPVYVLPEHVSRTLGREAQRTNILAARILADIVKTTLGPKGMDKMLVDSTGNVTITNDGVTILEEMELDHPAAKLIVDIAKAQEREVGDGTTTVALLAGTLLARAEVLLDRRIHPTAIVAGYRLAADTALGLLKELAHPVKSKHLLKQLAMTAMTGKGSEGYRERFADLLVEAVELVGEGTFIDQENIKFQHALGERTERTELIQGIVLDKDIAHPEMPRRVEKARIALLEFPLEVRGPETETKVSISSPDQFEQFLASEEAFIRNLVTKVIGSGANVVFCQKGIDDVAQYYLAKAGIMAFRRVPRSDMEKLAKATSASLVAHNSELNEASLGYAELVEEIKQGEDELTFVRGCKNPRAVTMLVKASTEHVAAEVERALRDGLGVVSAAVREGLIVAGGGALEIELSRRLREFARTRSGREQLAIEEFATALEIIPETLAENAGLDPITILTELKQRHAQGNVHDGLNLLHDKIEDCLAAGIIEPLKVKTQALSAATEVATMILRIDDVLVSAKAHSQQPGMSHEIDD